MNKLVVGLIGLMALSCAEYSQKAHENDSEISNEFKAYWYAGKAELNSYTLTQARYGEMRDGEAVLVFVTEPFNPKSLVKSDKSSSKDVSVLKCNYMKQFITGIYPYSMLTSSFVPVSGSEHALKVATSSQEWCGSTYMELKNLKKFEVVTNSYFESEANGKASIEKCMLEDELFSKIRMVGSDLPVGDLVIVPSFFYLRLMHQPLKQYNAIAELIELQTTYSYKIRIEELSRTIEISFSKEFPFIIEGWTEEYPDGFSDIAPLLKTEAKRIKTIKTDYWNKHSNSDLSYRDSLKLR